MGTQAHPMEGVIVDLSVVRKQMKAEYIADDGVICAVEQEILDGFDQMADVIRHVRAVERASNLYIRQGPSGLTEYGKQLWGLAGLDVDPLDAA